MSLAIRWGLLFTVGCFLGAQSLQEDPVMKARLQRSQAQGIDEADLPPVPRGIMVPPPLPPPEIHAKDSPQPRVAKVRRRGAKAARAGRRTKGAEPAEVVATAKAPRAARPAHGARQPKALAKVARKSGRRVKR
jgi:hypothetical protein